LVAHFRRQNWARFSISLQVYNGNSCHLQSCRNLFPVLSDNRSGRCGQCVRPIKHLPDLHIFYNFNWITHILTKSIKWFVYSFKWYLGILKVSTTHFCVTCGNKQRYQVCIMLAMHMFQGVTSYK
jgi:hypothetical protein